MGTGRRGCVNEYNDRRERRGALNEHSSKRGMESEIEKLENKEDREMGQGIWHGRKRSGTRRLERNTGK